MESQQNGKMLEEIKEDVKDIKKDVSGINVTLASQHVSLKAHMRRTDLLEKIVLMVAVGLGTLALAVLHH